MQSYWVNSFLRGYNDPGLADGSVTPQRVYLALEADAKLRKQYEEIDRLTGLLVKAGLVAFLREGTPEQIAEHFEKVAKSNIEFQAKLYAEQNADMQFYKRAMDKKNEMLAIATDALRRIGRGSDSLYALHISTVALNKIELV